MPSTPQLFSKALFNQNLQRFWPILAAYLFFVLIASFGFIVNYNYQEVITSEMFNNNLFSLSQLLALVVGFFSIAIAAAVYSYIHNSTATAMVNTLPYKRKTVFVSNYVSGLFMLLTPLLVFFLVLIGMGLNYNCLDILVLSKWLFIFTSLSILLYSLAVSIGMLTGHIIAHIAFFGIANVLFIGLELLINAFLTHFLYGFVSTTSRGAGLMEKATPILHTASLNYNSEIIGGNMLVWIIYLLVGVLLSWSALKLYQKRKMENTGDVMAIRALNPLFKYGVTFCSSLALGLVLIEIFNIQESFLWSVLLLLLAGMIGYFIAEMLLKKSYRVFGSYKGFVVYVLILIVVSASIYNDWYGYAARLPEVNKVEAVAFSDNGLSYYALRNLTADQSRIYMDEIPNLPTSLALTYGAPIEKVENNAGGYSYIYGNAENLTKEETRLLWSVIPGIYTEDKSIADIYKLHTYLSANIKEVRNNYRSRNNSDWYRQEGHQHSYYFISIIYRLDNGKTKTYNFPVLIPKQVTGESDKELLNKLASIAGSSERRSQKIGTVDLNLANIRHITIQEHIIRYAEKFPAQYGPAAQSIKESGEIKIAPEDYAGFLNALKADYLSMSDEEMLKLNRNNWGYMNFSIENLDLPINNKYRDRSSSLDIDYYHKNTLNFLYDKGYLSEEIYNFIQEYYKLVEAPENTSRKISLAAR